MQTEATQQAPNTSVDKDAAQSKRPPALQLSSRALPKQNGGNQVPTRKPDLERATGRHDRVKHLPALLRLHASAIKQCECMAAP